MLGKKRRISRIVKNGRSVILPMDHGITKPEKGIENVDRVVKEVQEYIDAVVVHKGVAKHSAVLAEMDAALIIHLSASTAHAKDPNDKRIVTSVEKAIALGADAVSVHINVGSKTEAEQIEKVGIISETCDDYGIPLLAMMYPRGSIEVNTETVRHAARIGYELGADILKVPYVQRFEEVVNICDIPVVVAGGSKGSEEEFLRRVHDALTRGASGVAAGRNVFNSDQPVRIAKTLHMLVHGNAPLEEVVKYERSMVVG